jgi:hypothetical protein
MRATLHVIVAILLLGGSLRADEPLVPTDVQLAVFAKVWTLDRNFPANGDVKMAVLYQSHYRTSMAVRDEIVQAAPGVPGLRCTFIDLDTDTNSLDRLLKPGDVQVIYIAPLRAFEVDGITRLARSRHLRTVTGVPEYVEQGVALGLTVRKDRPLILVNLNAARAEGSEFSSQLLKLARIVGGKVP